MLAAEKVVALSDEVATNGVPSNLSSEALRTLIERWSDARRRSDALFNIVRNGSLYERPIPERHRIIFYVGHLEAFDWNLLNTGLFGLKSLHPEYDRLFAFGIDPIGGGLPTDQPSEWPSLAAVHEYVGTIRSALDERLEKIIVDAPSSTRDGFPLSTLLNVAIEHRLMHVETLAYMLHQLPIAMKVRELDPPIISSRPIIGRAIEIPGGVVTLGLARGSVDFGWDNEFELQTAEIPAFEIDQYKVTNRQYLEFMQAGGYETQSFWSEDDWNWKAAHAISHPSFWMKKAGTKDNRWFYRTMFAELPFDEVPSLLDWPVYVSHAEASAYARWAGKRLPTEAEWQRAAHGTAKGETRKYPWGSESPNPKLGNFDFRHWDPTPVNAFPQGQSAFGVHDMLGNGWEWTSTVFAPFDGFVPFPFYKGYSADFFDGKHFVIKGGSSRTAACMLRSTFRNWFQPHYQYVYSGFRCVSR
jgi:gamma-glutamyl hercynylcysteine S-oxide synthase